MAKAPIAGTVKTRLVPPLTAAQAADLCRSLLLDQLEHLRALAVADLYVAYAPSDARAVIEELMPPEFRCFSQSGKDLGTRMSKIFDRLLDHEYQRVVLIGGDLPALPLSYLEQAFETLEAPSKRLVLGPSRDGGYYLVGMNRRTPEIFQAMTWSHDRVLAQTLARLAAMGIGSELLPGWFDIDTTDDLRRLKFCTDASFRARMKNTLSLLPRLTF
jgi:rSAM/selenodomain-associated transferase 1